MKHYQLTWDTGPVQVLTEDQLAAEYSSTNLFDPSTWDSEHRMLHGSLLHLLEEIEPGDVWTCDNVSIQLTCIETDACEDIMCPVHGLWAMPERWVQLPEVAKL